MGKRQEAVAGSWHVPGCWRRRAKCGAQLPEKVEKPSEPYPVSWLDEAQGLTEGAYIIVLLQLGRDNVVVASDCGFVFRGSAPAVAAAAT